jgi:hypothetical protein
MSWLDDLFPGDPTNPISIGMTAVTPATTPTTGSDNTGTFHWIVVELNFVPGQVFGKGTSIRFKRAEYNSTRVRDFTISSPIWNVPHGPIGQEDSPMFTSLSITSGFIDQDHQVVVNNDPYASFTPTVLPETIPIPPVRVGVYGLYPLYGVSPNGTFYTLYLRPQ